MSENQRLRSLIAGSPLKRELTPEEQEDRQRLWELFETLTSDDVLRCASVDTRRTERIEVRATMLQKRIIDEMARQFGLTASDLLVRMAMMGAYRIAEQGGPPGRR